MFSKNFFLLATVLSFGVPSTGLAEKKEVWLYTSIYKEFATPLKEAFEAKNKDISVQIFQAGSEKIQAKLEAELIAKKPQADVIVASDPFFLANLEERKLLSPLKGGTIRNNYFSVMTLLCHKKIASKDRPKSFADLTKPEFKGKLQFSSPLESGTAFATVAYLSQKLGWTYFEKLRANHLGSQGGNSSVIQKIESGEKNCGMALLENILAAQKKGSPIEAVFPDDGSFAIPSVQGVLASSKNLVAAKVFADFILEKEAQEILRKGYMYSVRKDVAAPEGAPALDKIAKSDVWTPEFVAGISKQTKTIKNKFAELILE
jgi:iron(III) transport system substrate-binding protein